MIATHADKCLSRECPHLVPHAENEFCHDGQCRWSSECRCVPESKRERLEGYLIGLLQDADKSDISEIADAIEAIYET